jgi:hypothetical protein
VGDDAGEMRVRRRAVAVGLATLVLAGTGVGLDRWLGPRPIDGGSARGAISGSWFCPQGGAEGWKGWVVITNPGTASVQVRLTSFGADGIRSVTAFPVPPERQIYHEVFAGSPSASSQVEYFGGWVGAATIVRAGGVTAPVAAERCADAPARAWFLPDEPTGRDEEAFVVVMNPFAEAASFDVVIRTERREIRPKSLSPFVLSAHRSVGIRMNDYVLKEPGERTVAAFVFPRIGRVVAGGLAVSDGGLRAEPGASSPRMQVVVPAAGYSGAGELLLVNPMASPADLLVVGEGAMAQRRIAGPGGVSVAPHGVRTLVVDGLPDAGVVVHGTEGAAVVAAMRLSGEEGGDSATITGEWRAGPSWLVMPTLPPAGGRAFLVLENPGRVIARVTVRLLGEDGLLTAAGLQSLPIGAGRTIQIPLPASGDAAPLSAVVTAEEGTLVAAGASYSQGGAGYATTLGLPMKE